MDEPSIVVPALRARIGSLAAGLLVLAGCTARTLPLPPPVVDPIDGPNAQGLVMVTGTAQEGAAVGVLNESAGLGVIVTSPKEGCERTCPFEAQIAAEPGDALRIWQFFETSSSAERLVPE